MGKFVDVYLDGFGIYILPTNNNLCLKKNQIRPIFSDEHSTRSYSAMLTLVNKVESNVLYKVRLSTHAKKNVMVKSNMGLLLANNITTITLDVVDNDEPAFNVQIVTTPFDEEKANLQRQGISLTNFNDMWAFVPENRMDKTILRFNREAVTGKPTATFYSPAIENSNQQEQEVMTVADDKSGTVPSSTDSKPLTAQNLAEALSLVQQQNVDQEDEIYQLKSKVKTLSTSSNMLFF